MQDIDNAKNFLERNSITTFAQLEKFRTDKDKEFDSREQIFIPKWKRLEQLEKEMPTLRNERARACHDLAFAEVISYNRANLERVEQNESRQQDKQQGKTNRRKKFNENAIEI